MKVLIFLPLMKVILIDILVYFFLINCFFNIIFIFSFILFKIKEEKNNDIEKYKTHFMFLNKVNQKLIQELKNVVHRE